MLNKPTEVTKWAEQNAANGINLTDNKTVSTDIHQDFGWDFPEKPPRNILNYWMNAVWLWLGYLENLTDSVTQSFDIDLQASDYSAGTIVIRDGNYEDTGGVSTTVSGASITKAGSEAIRLVLDVAAGTLIEVTTSPETEDLELYQITWSSGVITNVVDLRPATVSRLATTIYDGLVRLANNSEATAGTNNTTAMTPAGSRSHGDARYTQMSNLVSELPIADNVTQGISERATSAEAIAETDDERHITSKVLSDFTDNTLIRSATTATTSTKGAVNIATTLQVDTGTDDEVVVTPLKLAQNLTTYPQFSDIATQFDFGVTKYATQPETDSGVNDGLAISPATLTTHLSNIGIVVDSDVADQVSLGISRFATAAEMDAGTSLNLAVSPNTLVNYLAERGGDSIFLDAVQDTGFPSEPAARAVLEAAYPAAKNIGRTATIYWAAGVASNYTLTTYSNGAGTWTLENTNQFTT